MSKVATISKYLAPFEFYHGCPLDNMSITTLPMPNHGNPKAISKHLCACPMHLSPLGGLLVPRKVCVGNSCHSKLSWVLANHTLMILANNGYPQGMHMHILVSLPFGILGQSNLAITTGISYSLYFPVILLIQIIQYVTSIIGH